MIARGNRFVYDAPRVFVVDSDGTITEVAT